MENDDLRGKIDVLRKRIHESQFSTGQTSSAALDALRKEYAEHKEKTAKFVKESTEAFETLKKKASDDVKDLKKQVKLKQDEAMVVSMECEELKNRLKELNRPKVALVAVSTQTATPQQITLDLPTKKPDEKFDLSILMPSKPQLDQTKKSKISGILKKVETPAVEKPVPVSPASQPPVASMKKQAGPATATSGRSKINSAATVEDNDFMDMKNNNCVTRLLEAEGEDFSKQTSAQIFSDEIIRINSNQERKVRILLVTKYSLYILIQEGFSKFAVKSKAKLHDIFRIEIPNGNSMLVHMKFNEK